MRINYFISLLAVYLIATTAYGQIEANYWYFGQNAGVSFATGEPVAQLDGALNTWEGCSSISSSTGALRFYTDGSWVYDRNHQQMPNGSGLLGDPSSAQSGLVVPKPADNQKYYIFTVDDVDAGGGYNGLNYSLVDMTLNGWAGDVVASEKNVKLTSPLCEKVTAVGHKNGFDTWVITQKWGSNDFYVYLVTNEGVDPVPVISSAGIEIGISGHGIDVAKGYMKVSPDGSTLAKGNAGLRSLEIFSFDNETGVVSDGFIDAGVGGEPYGIEFSPDNSKLYVNTWKSNPGMFLLQYNLEAGSNSDIINSRTVIASGTNGALQLAPDNRIYVVRAQTGYLSRINRPNKLGSSCSYESNAVYLEGRTSMWGLPPFVQSFFSFNAGFVNEPPCYGTPTQFYENSTTTPDSVFWDFGNPASGADNYSTEYDPTHLYTAPGLYSVKLKVWIEGHEDLVAKFFNVHLPPDVDLGDDTFFCEGDTYVMDAGEGYTSYLWSTDDTTHSISVQTAGTYWVEVSNESECWTFDTIVLNAFEKPNVDLGPNKEFCEGTLHELDAGTGFASYLWNTGDTTQTLVVQTTDSYWVVVYNDFGCPNSDTIVVNFNLLPIADAGPLQTINQGETATLEGSASSGTGSYSFRWEPDNMLQQNDIPDPTTIALVDPQLYTLVVTDDKQCVSLSSNVLINIFGSDMGAFPLADPAEICEGDATLVSANASGGGGEYTYEWTSTPPGFTSNQAEFNVSPSSTTTYNLKLKDQFDNMFESSVQVFVIESQDIDLIPDYMTPYAPDTIAVCVRDSVILDAGSDDDPPTTTYFWTATNKLGRYFKATTNGNWMDIQTHTVKVNYGGETACENFGVITIIFDFNQCAIDIEEKPVDDYAIELYPNPNSGSFTILAKREITDLVIKVFDLNGREVISDMINGSHPQGYKQNFRLPNAEKGIYVVHFITANYHLVKKMIVN